ncbi:MAG: nicotinate-nucleotide--dimethylbenzimidazole phosphoribosyltransferase [Lachnospiraceae bacterium]|nr:nicotinate-nucleotide--dimethylbenzimidazole phosphoribosyltransferase [Lachnospiraceae bacterium]
MREVVATAEEDRKLAEKNLAGKKSAARSLSKRSLWELRIDEPDELIRAQVQTRIDRIAKPLDSLGKFEAYLAQIGAITGKADIDIRKKAVLVMCADNGIVEEGVSQCGPEVTRQVAESMGRGTSNVCKMARVVGTDVIPVDVGIAGTEAVAGVLNRKVMPGTKNFRKEPAMTAEQLLEAICVGMDLAAECKEKGYQILATGEMGIGNTTTSAAVAAALTGFSAERIVGRGAGLSDAGLVRKREIVQEALFRYASAGERSGAEMLISARTVPGSKQELMQDKTLQILSCVGGLDIAAMAGVFIGGAIVHLPVVIDGVISAVAALVAERLVPGVKAYMIPSHKSKEPAADVVFQALGMEPVIQGNLALGEGTGAVMLFGLLDLAMALYEKPTTFEDIAVEQYQRF